MLLTQDFYNKILLEPAAMSNRLYIVSGYMDCDRMATHLIALKDGIDSGKYMKDISVSLIIGMTDSSGLTQKKHFKILQTISNLTGKNMPQIECRYISQGAKVHSKVYAWSAYDRPTIAYCGSVNYSMAGFHYRRELMTDCNPDEAIHYYNSLLDSTVSCEDPKAATIIGTSQTKSIRDSEPDADDFDYSYYDKMTPVDTLNVSLLTSKGEVGYGSGINWGIRPNGTKREPNQAYIPYNRSDKKQGFFPDRINPGDKNCPVFKVCTSDGKTFHMRMAQDGNKALHSAENNSILGMWIRKKLGVNGFITKAMLVNYGRTYVTFRKYADGTYLLDF